MLIQKQYNKLILQEIQKEKKNANTTMLFIFEKTEETVLDFLQGTVKVF